MAMLSVRNGEIPGSVQVPEKNKWAETASDVEIVERFKELNSPRRKSDSSYRVGMRTIERRVYLLLLRALTHGQ